MPGKDKMTLIESLEISIQRISDQFKDDWLIGGSQEGIIKTDKNSKKNVSSGRKSNQGYDESYPMDSHPFLEVCVCVSGRFAMEIKDRHYEINEGEACIIFPDIMHNESSAKDTDHLAIWLAYDSNRVRIHLSGNRQDEFFTSDLRTLVSDHEYNGIINNINTEKMNQNAYSNMLFKLHLLHMLIITRNKISIEVSSDTESDLFRKKIVEEVKEYIEDKGFGYLHLRDISRNLYISAGYLNNIFKSITGITIMQYIENRRIERAMYLLKNTNESVTSISRQLGYYDQYHFSKSFKKVTKDSPTQYRKAVWE